MKRSAVIFVLLIFVVACGPYIWFKVPQPEGEENLKAFPDELHGKYRSALDTVMIIIHPDKIIREYRENMVMSQAEFMNETGDTISKDTSFMFSDNWHITIHTTGDSVKVYSTKDEELFHISEKQLLREYKGYYFLNYKDTNNYWKVKLLRLEQDSLEFDFILDEEDLQNIRNITSIETRKDSTEKSTRYFLDPSRRELRKILRRRASGEKYIKNH